MKMTNILSLVVVLIAVVAAVRPVTYSPPISEDFTANITIIDAGMTFTGYMVYDYSGQRMFRFIKELNETTYTFQAFDTAVTYMYVIMNSGCTCQQTPAATLPLEFSSLSVATPTGKPCINATGTLFVNDFLNGLPGLPSKTYCVDGNVPKYVQMASKFTYYHNFKPGRPAVFPASPMNQWVDECANACI